MFSLHQILLHFKQPNPFCKFGGQIHGFGAPHQVVLHETGFPKSSWSFRGGWITHQYHRLHIPSRPVFIASRHHLLYLHEHPNNSALLLPSIGHPSSRTPSIYVLEVTGALGSGKNRWIQPSGNRPPPARVRGFAAQAWAATGAIARHGLPVQGRMTSPQPQSSGVGRTGAPWYPFPTVLPESGVPGAGQHPRLGRRGRRRWNQICIKNRYLSIFFSVFSGSINGH